MHPAVPTGAMSQPVSEWMVAELMWDLSDGPGGDHDPVAATPEQVFAVLTGYLVSPQRVARGHAGVDFAGPAGACP